MERPSKRKKKGKLKLESQDFSKLKNKQLFEQLTTMRDDLIKRNNLLLEKQKRDEKEFKKEKKYDFLYPYQDDPDFNSKIIRKREFNDLIHKKDRSSIQEQFEEICTSNVFELMHHQLFVRNYLSFNTPYNNLLLFHGLGTGKTCSAITITEMMRTYFNQLGITKRIIIVASPNVQTNFKTQLFDKEKLEKIGGLWNLNACTGNKYLKEINPMNMKGLTRPEVIKLINRIINKSYLFMGAEQFANYISKTISKYSALDRQIKLLKREFSNRMIVIDEVHNIRISGTHSTKKSSKQLMFLAEHADNLKLLLLTATPMFNSNEEIVWLLNLMNTNDKRPTINIGDVFDSNGDLLIDENGREKGKEILIQKSRSYISYMRGENPYSFPLKVLPTMHLKQNTMKQYKQPVLQMNDIEIVQPIQYLDLFITTISDYQNKVYTKLIEQINSIHGKKGMGYNVLSLPLQALTITYPNTKFDEYVAATTDTVSDSGGAAADTEGTAADTEGAAADTEGAAADTEGAAADTEETTTNVSFNFQNMVGKRGLKNIMTFDQKNKNNFQYKQTIIEKYGRIFSRDVLKNYSSKLSYITNSAIVSEGIILIYSQYIDGGCLPTALALEELGLSRYGGNNFFKVKPTVKSEYTYAMITGDISISPNNAKEIATLTNKDNTDGSKIKVVIISEAGSEGIDLKNIRQVHIIDPWYNLGRNEQITGRAIRNCSHKDLPFEKRNTEIYMHATQLLDNRHESTDCYLYRISEYKAIKIGSITRILKSTATDCVINKDVILNDEKVNISISSGQNIDYDIGDRPHTYTCDYMDTCNYDCDSTFEKGNISQETYNDTFITFNNDIIMNRIKELFKERHVYSKADIIGRINYTKKYPIIQIDSALSRFVNDNSVFVSDIYNNMGRIINIGLFYLYQPANIEYEKLSVYERSHVPNKRNKKIRVLVKDHIINKTTLITKILEKLKTNFKNSFKEHPDSNEKDLDWYKAVGNFFINRNIIKIQKNIFSIFIIKHILDTMDLKNKITLFNYVISNKPADAIEGKLQDVVNEYIISGKYIIIADFNIENLVYFTINESNQLRESTPTEKIKIIKKLVKEKRYNLSDIYGFIDNFKNKYTVFKIGNTTNPRDKGFRADQKGKKDMIEMINNLAETEIYTYANTKKIGNSKEFSADLEIIFRFYNDIKKDGKNWFLSYEDYIIFNYLISKKKK